MKLAADKDRSIKLETRTMKPENGDWIQGNNQEFMTCFDLTPHKLKCIASTKVLTSRNLQTSRLMPSLTKMRNRTHLIILFFFICIIAFSCQSVEKNVDNKNSVVDGTGRTVEINQSPKTVMALSPSMTELLFKLVSNEQIVGRTDQCNYPEACLSLPKVQVYPTVNLEKVLKIKPDIIISNSEITPPETAEKLTQLGVPVLLYEINSIEKLYKTIHELSKILSVEGVGDSLIRSYKLQIANLESDKLSSINSTLSAIALISIDPIYVHGKTSFLNEIMGIAGFGNAIDSTFGSYPQVSRSLLLKINPDYLLGYSFEALDSTFFELYPELRGLKAYQNKNIYSLNGDLASRPSPRFIELIEEMRKIRSRNH